MAEFHTAAVALGSNLGDRAAYLAAGLLALASLPRSRIIARSRLYQTRAIALPPAAPGPDYLNAAALVETSLEPPMFMGELLRIEASCGRIRSPGGRWGDRTLDLDLLFYGDRVVDSPTLKLPHPAMHQRRFVLQPLSDIAPGWRHPVFHKTVKELLAQTPDDGGVVPISGDRPPAAR